MPFNYLHFAVIKSSTDFKLKIHYRLTLKIEVKHCSNVTLSTIIQNYYSFIQDKTASNPTPPHITVLRFYFCIFKTPSSIRAHSHDLPPCVPGEPDGPLHHGIFVPGRRRRRNRPLTWAGGLLIRQVIHTRAAWPRGGIYIIHTHKCTKSIISIYS